MALIPSLPQPWTKFAPLLSYIYSFVKEPKNFFQVLFWAQVSQSCCPQRWIVFETSPSSCSRCRLSLKYSLLWQQFLSHFCTSSCLFVEGVQICCVRAPFQKQRCYTTWKNFRATGITGLANMPSTFHTIVSFGAEGHVPSLNESSPKMEMMKRRRRILTLLAHLTNYSFVHNLV
jgi:hypothetical protein